MSGPLPKLRQRRFAARYLTLFGGEALSKLCVLAAFAHLARVLGPYDFGLIELALSIVVFFTLGVESGLGSYGARQVTANPDGTSALVPRVIVLRLLLGVPAYLAILVVSASYGMPGVGVLAVYGLTVLIVPFFTQWVFQGLRQMQWIASGTALRNFLFAAIVLLVIRPGSDPRLVAVAEVCGVVALALLNAVVLTRVIRLRLQWRGALAGAWPLFRETWSLGASDLTWACLWYSPTILLGWLVAAEEVAWQAGSVRIVLALHTFVWLYFFNLLPNLSKELIDGLDSWRDLVQRSVSTALWPACLIALGGTLLSPLLVTTIYGPAYASAARPFQIVVWMIPVAWFSGHFRFSLIASGHQRSEFFVSAVTAAVTLTLGLLLVPRLYSVGGAIALMAGGLVNAWLAVVMSNVKIGRQTVRHMITPAAVACVACLAGGWLVALVAGDLAGTTVACLAYAVVALRQDNELVDLIRVRLVRLRQAPLGR